MPSWQWSYPYNAADTATVHFDASPADTLYHWRAPHRDTPVPRHTVVQTADGGIRSYKLGNAGRLIVLRFIQLPAGSDASATQLYGYLGLLSFLEDHLDFSQETFGFYDHTVGAAEIEVRYMSGIETFVLNQGRYDGQVVLRKELI